MEFVANDTSVALLPNPQTQEPLDLSFASVFGGGFRQENEIVNMTRLFEHHNQGFEPDPEFNLLDAAENDPLFEEYSDSFVWARSQDEYNAIKKRIQGELLDKQILASAGVAGFLAAAVGAMVSPLSLIPLVGPARGVKAFAESAALAAGAAGAQEAALFGLQEARTMREVAFGIAGATVIGGLLGGMVKNISRADLGVMEQGMASSRGQVAILTSDATGAPMELRMNTIAERELPPLSATPARGDEITVYGVEGTPRGAEIESISDGIITLRLDDGETAVLGRGYEATPPQSPEFPVVYNGRATPVQDIPNADLRPLKFALEEEMVVRAKQRLDTQDLMAQRNAILIEASRRAADEPKFETLVKTLDPEDIAEERWDGKPTELPGLFKAEAPVLELEGGLRTGDQSIGAAQTRNIPESLQRQNTRLAAASRELRQRIERSDFGGDGMVGKLLRGTAARVVSPDIIGTMARLNPVTRSLESRFPMARYWGAQMQSAGLRLQMAMRGVSPTEAGDMVHRALTHEAKTVKFLLAFDQAFVKHVFGREAAPKVLPNIAAQLKSRVGKMPAGKMSFKEFQDAVFDTHNTGAVAPNPEVADAARALKEFFDYAEATAKEYHEYRKLVDDPDAPKLFEEFEGDELGNANYVRHQFDPDYILDHMDEFLRDVTDHGEQLLQSSFAKAFRRYQTRVENLEETKRLLALDDAGRADEYARVVTELEALETSDAWVLGRKQLADYRAQLKQSGADESEVNKAVREFEKGLGEDYGFIQEVRRGVIAKRRTLEKMGATLTEEQQKLSEEILKLESQQLAQLETLERAVRKAERKLTRLTDDVHEGKLATTRKEILQAAKTWRESTAKLDDLLASDALAKYDRTVDRADRASVRLDGALTRLGKLLEFSPEEARRAVDDALVAVRERSVDLNAKRAVRAENLKQKLDEADPVARATMRDEAMKAAQKNLEDLEDLFTEQWRLRGAEDLSLTEGKASFRAQAEDDAKQLYNKIQGNGQRISGLDIIGAARGSQLTRASNLPYDIKRKYLVRDPEKVVRAYAHSMFPDMELYRATGSPNGAKMFRELEDDFNVARDKLVQATHLLDGQPVVKGAVPEADQARLKPLTEKTRVKLSEQLQKEIEQVREDFGVMVTRFRHQRGMPQKASGMAYRMGRFARNLNVTRLMGSVVPSSLPDVARPIFKFGLTKTLRDGWAPYITDLKMVKLSREAAIRLNIATEMHMHNRSAAVFDVGENYARRQTMPERGMEFLANKTGFVALFDAWTSEMKQIATRIWFVEFSHALEVLATGKQGKAFDEASDFIAQMGLSREMADRIWKQYQLPDGSTAVRNGAVRLPNTDVWTDSEAFMAMGAAGNRAANDMIVTPALDRPNWVDANEAFRLVAQFRSFTFTSNNRVLMASLQEPDMAVLAGTISSLAMGAVSYYTWAVAIGGEPYRRAMEGDLEQWAYEATGRSGLLGVLAEGQRVGEQIPVLNDLAIFGGEFRATRRANSIIGQALGPSSDLAERSIGILQSLDSPTQSTIHTARTLAPYQNVFYWRRLFSALEEGVNETFDIPERRDE